MTCEHCGTEFAAHKPGQRYCTERCRKAAENRRRKNKYRQGHLEKNCLICGKVFTVVHNADKFCSAVCKKKADRTAEKARRIKNRGR